MNFLLKGRLVAHDDTQRDLFFPDAPVVTIASFSPKLLVFTSKQRPRKLTIHGSDGEEYTFLLKGHEDLRLDERVMQVHLHFSFQLSLLVPVVRH